MSDYRHDQPPTQDEEREAWHQTVLNVVAERDKALEQVEELLEAVERHRRAAALSAVQFLSRDINLYDAAETIRSEKEKGQ